MNGLRDEAIDFCSQSMASGRNRTILSRTDFHPSSTPQEYSHTARAPVTCSTSSMQEAWRQHVTSTVCGPGSTPVPGPDGQGER